MRDLNSCNNYHRLIVCKLIEIYSVSYFVLLILSDSFLEHYDNCQSNDIFFLIFD